MENEKIFFETLFDFFAERKKFFISVFGIVLGFVFIAGASVLFPSAHNTLSFLSVGQGDSEFVTISTAKFLIDGGSANGRVVVELQRVMPFWDRSIDAIFLTHPEEDHFGGLLDVVRRFQVAAFFSTGAESDSREFQDFKKELQVRHIPIYTLSAGDRIHVGNSLFEVLSPKRGMVCAKTNECALVLFLHSEEKSILFTADIPAETEKTILPFLTHVDILKIAHHGSRYSTSESFLLKTSPRAAIIEVGKNSYGHPSPETIERLKKFGIPVFRTDEEGTIQVLISSSSLDIFRLE